MTTPEHALVIGGTGELGTAFGDSLIKAGYAVTTVARNRATYCFDITADAHLAKLKLILDAHRYSIIVVNTGKSVRADIIADISHLAIQRLVPGGKLIVVCSILGFVPDKYNRDYAARKAYMISYSRSLELLYTDKVVVTLCPNMMREKRCIAGLGEVLSYSEVADIAIKHSGGILIPGFRNTLLVRCVSCMPFWVQRVLLRMFR